MKALIDFDGAPVFAIPARDGYPGFDDCEGMLIEGPQGWGEFCPPRASTDLAAARWLTSAIEGGTVGWPDAVRGRVAVSVPVPAVSPPDAGVIVAGSGCLAADVRVTGRSDALADDADRLAAVRAALGASGAIRCAVERAWDVEGAAAAIPVLHAAAGGLEFVQQPCATAGELAALRLRVGVPIAVDAADVDVEAAELARIADIAVLAVGPLGGVRRALRFAERCGLPCVVSGDRQTSIGLAGGLALAGALPDLRFACGLGTATVLAGDVVSAGRTLIPADGYLPVAPMAPAPDVERLAQFSLHDTERIVWWRRRLTTASELV
ncbi:O-succinylbenzoate synthase [Mycobacterium sp. CVI_P3]|uniref:O-succinylbenzoate synthase n=1 Tax=Mycobacterium pinniadriaticum TaxID=2994102 RepID=A0ABT3S988_9MYCO|nr:enolase C-terminal domain-like protein [Mycobacterium pinniadriaticum]MCX2929513.1 O-succinylbenzoate synthase [Mycobacterium pinniadriaticum]MCX2935937.1 O-succinylbenzoate synthase [Mycobacterium pinniadriaticum]